MLVCIGEQGLNGTKGTLMRKTKVILCCVDHGVPFICHGEACLGFVLRGKWVPAFPNRKLVLIRQHESDARLAAIPGAGYGLECHTPVCRAQSALLVAKIAFAVRDTVELEQ